MTVMRHDFVPQFPLDGAEWVNCYKFSHGRKHCGLEWWLRKEDADAAREAYFQQARDTEKTSGKITGFDLSTWQMNALPRPDAEKVRDTTFCWAKDCTESFAARVRDFPL